MPIINQIVKGGGTTPTGTLPITNNGTYDVTNYASADVQVPTTAPAYYREFKVVSGVLSPNTTTTHLLDFSTITTISDIMLYDYMNGNHNITGNLDLSTIQDIRYQGLARAFYNTYITSVDLSGLTAISGAALQNTFGQCSQLVSANLSGLKKISSADSALSSTFYSCPSITSVNIDNLEAIHGASVLNYFLAYSSIPTFSAPRLVSLTGAGIYNYSQGPGTMVCTYCPNLASVFLPSLKILTAQYALYSAFGYTQLLTELKFPAVTTTSFGSYKNQFNNMCAGISSITLHFPSNVQTQVEALTGYSTTAPFGASAGTVLFDLPATVILTGANSQAYERSPKDDTATALAWRKQDTGTAPNLVIDWTPFYTSGTTDPAVSDTIYSDSACITAVTTISSIA